MELFKLIGSIAVDTSSANEAIDETTKKAGDSGGKMSKVLTGIGNAGKKLEVWLPVLLRWQVVRQLL